MGFCSHSLHSGRIRNGLFSQRSRLLALFVLLGVIPCSPQTNVLTYHNDNARTGRYLNETTLTPGNVNSNSFGKIGFLDVDGKVDAQPLYLSNVNVAGRTHNILYVATEHDSVYAFDADTGELIWQASLLGAGETSSDDRGCDPLRIHFVAFVGNLLFQVHFLGLVASLRLPGWRTAGTPQSPNSLPKIPCPT